jgi:hypothetical protein
MAVTARFDIGAHALKDVPTAAFDGAEGKSGHSAGADVLAVIREIQTSVHSAMI